METSKQSRRYDIDWLRVIAFFILVFFHVAVLFLPNGIPSITNSESSPVVGAMAIYLHQFRLSLLFFISGLGIQLSTAGKTTRLFIKERSKRLLIPLFFGFTVLVPPMIYFEKLYNGAFLGSFIEFYPQFYTKGVYPQGNMSWHHFWFLAYLFLMCLISWPLFQYFKGSGSKVLALLSRALCSRFGLYKLIVLFVLIEFALRPSFPGMRDLLSDWASFLHWWLVFIVGYVISSHSQLLDRCRELRWLSLAIALFCTCALFLGYYDVPSYEFVIERNVTSDNRGLYLVFVILKMTMVWCNVLTFVGFAAQHLNKPSRLLSYLNGATYPLFCLHLTVTVVLAYYIIPMSISILAKLFILTLGTYALVFLLYELFIKRISMIKPLFGAR